MSRARCAACAKDAERNNGPGRPHPDAAIICARVFGKRVEWWDKTPGYVRDEIKRALRRPNDRAAPRWLAPPKRETLAATSARLARAELSDPRSGKTWTGPRAAEEWITYRRQQLGIGALQEVA